MIATILDYGAGNLHSLSKALSMPGVAVRTETNPLDALETDVLVLPGVGAFGQAAERLAPARLVLRRAILGGLPCFGICLGMQLLFEASDEGPGLGLGVFSGRVRRLRSKRIPHIGWNSLEEGYTHLRIAYFANSFVCEPDDPSIVIARTTHDGDTFASAVRRNNVVGVQFHPEKSGAAGVAFLRGAIEAPQ